MSSNRRAIVSPTWAPFYEETLIPAAVRLNDHLHGSGHTGEDHEGHFSVELEAQIRGTFRNLTETLTEAGATWSDVVSLTSYHVGLRGQEAAVLRVAGEFLEAPYPAWTALGVTELWRQRRLSRSAAWPRSLVSSRVSRCQQRVVAATGV